MTVCLVHHADAVSPTIDTRRPLSRLGVAQAEWLAARARDHGIKPDVIWHSGKLRARETAEIFLRACNPFAAFTMERGLRPDDAAPWMRDVLRGESRHVLLVGHMPHLPELLRELTGTATFPSHGLVWLERQAAGGFVEIWRAECPLDPLSA
jgi:phosphohistidine phosphatase